MGKSRDIDFEIIKGMSEEQQQQAYYTLSKRANQRMRDINKTGLSSGAVKKTKLYLNETYNRETFKQSKKLTGIELKEGLQKLEEFYKYKTATVQGIREQQKKHDKIFEEKGISISDIDKKLFYQFLSSHAFEVLSHYADSDQVARDYNTALEDGFTPEQIMEGYHEFLTNDMTFEEVKERRDKHLNYTGGELLQ